MQSENKEAVGDMYAPLASPAFARKAKVLAQLKRMRDHELRIPVLDVGLTEKEALEWDKEDLIDAVSEKKADGTPQLLVWEVKRPALLLAYIWETRPRSLWQRIVEEMESRLPQWSSEFIKWGIVFLAGFGLRWLSEP
jgi:hypothetical protein